ncbi:MAG: hypothetical protein JXR68_02515 [Bacteroidales bacterium]|nr:hypothetical protein [Bacteroidales bacterium]
MENPKQPKKTQEDYWRDVLYSSDSDSIKELLIHLRTEGNVKILPDVINIYKGYKKTKLGENIYDFLCDIKCSDATNLLIDFINNKDFFEIRKELVSLCWQTGLDFAKYFMYFVDLFIKTDLQTAFEAFTTIEYIELEKNDPVINLAIDKLQLSIDQIAEDKKELLVDLVNVIRKKQK